MNCFSWTHTARTTVIKERTAILIPTYVKTMPEKLEQGLLYISYEYEMAIHLCACGQCNNKTVTPFGDGGWTLTDDAGLITLSPSIGNFQFPCRSHYYITNNEVQWL